ncbi:MAG: DUF2817 domain-containing protein [Armatimonadia bacterium]
MSIGNTLLKHWIPIVGAILALGIIIQVVALVQAMTVPKPTPPPPAAVQPTDTPIPPPGLTPAAAPPAPLVQPALPTPQAPAPVTVASLPAKAPAKAPAKKATKPASGSFTIGTSVRGKSIVAYRLGSGSERVIVLGGFHGNEPDGVNVCRSLLKYLQSTPSALKGRQVIIVPAVNPDGLAAGTRVNAHKVDINRNWSRNWRPKAAKDKYNPGPRPLSEPETQAVAKLLRQYPPDKVINLHQPLRCLNPTGTGIHMARAMKRCNGYPIKEDIGYPTPGSFGDYCGLSLGAAMLTVEFPAGSGHWSANREAMLAAITCSLSGSSQPASKPVAKAKPKPARKQPAASSPKRATLEPTKGTAKQ